MRLYEVALNEIRRRKIRTAYTASGVVISVALLVASVIVGVASQKDIMLIMNRYGHSLTIFPATHHEQTLRGFGIGTGHYIPESAMPAIEKVYDAAIRSGWQKRGGWVMEPGMPGGVDMLQPAIFSPRLYEETKLGDRAVVVAGVDPEKEYKTRFWWEMETGKLVARPDEVMCGSVYGKITGAKPGDNLTINGRTFKVTGVLKETDSPDDYMVFGMLNAVQDAFGKQGLVSMINVRAMCNYCPVGDAELELNRQVVGVRATSQRELAEAQHKIFQNVTNVILGFVVLSLAIACMAMFNMMMGAVHGRIREIGLLKMLGASPGQLVRLFIYEAVLVGMIGGLVGYALGLAAARIIAPWLIPGSEVELSWWHPPMAIAAAVLCSILATLYPAIYASRVRAAEAFRAL
ncbi:MAG: FtsX-like permease family protein [Hyphomicrobiales bacterium]|nr:FtsX-like permease family protein [Hyphomicrobiales bacterium]